MNSENFQTHLFLLESSLSTQEVSYSIITHKQIYADKPVGQHATAPLGSDFLLPPVHGIVLLDCVQAVLTSKEDSFQEIFFSLNPNKSHCLSFLLIDGLHAATEIVP